MQTVYQLHRDELDENFLAALKTLFKDKQIQIVVSEMDETTYLLGSEANRKQLMDAIQAVETGDSLVEYNLEEAE